jgi:hypothetical protein
MIAEATPAAKPPIMKPEPSSRHPLIVFLLSLCFLSGSGIALGGPAPGSINEQLSREGVYLWATMLAAGAGTVLIGLALQANHARLVVGVLLEQVGVVALGFAAIIYSAAAFGVVGWSGTLPAGVTFTFGVACLYRWVSLQRQLNSEGWVARVSFKIAKIQWRISGKFRWTKRP